MYSQSFAIGAYEPGWTAEQRGKAEQQVAVLDGENFFFNMRGVQSGFGVADVCPFSLGSGFRHPAIFSITDAHIVFDDGKVSQYDGAALNTLYTYAADMTHPVHDLDAYKWSYAYVGTRHWFSHPRVSQLVYYDEFDKTWGTYRDTCWNGPIYGVTHADNRLVVLLSDVVVWSKFDEGHVFNCDWHCGSGAQSLALIRYGQPYAVMPYNNGWITCTSMGIMLSVPDYSQTLDPDAQRIGVGLLAYKHEEANFAHMPTGPAAITHIEEKSVVWLAASGFWQFAPTQGGGFGAVQPYAQQMGRFYRETLIPQLSRSLAALDTFAMHYVPDLQWLFVSSRVGLDYGYARAHVYQLPLERWGSFNQPHLSIGTGRLNGEIAAQITGPRHFAVIGEDFKLKRFDPMLPTARSWVKFTPMRFQIPQEDTQVETFSSVQGVRVGLSGHAAPYKPTTALRSSWTDDKLAEHRPSIFDLLISSGLDAETSAIDEESYCQMVTRTSDIAMYSCHSTGLNHVITAAALEQHEHFDIRQIEMSFFWAGVK